MTFCIAAKAITQLQLFYQQYLTKVDQELNEYIICDILIGQVKYSKTFSQSKFGYSTLLWQLLKTTTNTLNIDNVFISLYTNKQCSSSMERKHGRSCSVLCVNTCSIFAVQVTCFVSIPKWITTQVSHDFNRTLAYSLIYWIQICYVAKTSPF